MKLRKDAIDISGQRFGKLIAIEPVDRKIKRGVEWRCICDCGKETFAFGGHLRSDYRKSCGCISSEKFEETGTNIIFNEYFRKAKKRKLDFDLSFLEFKDFIKGHCHYCGIEPSSIRKAQGRDKIQIIWNGIDRIDSNKGYILENCVSCCKYCNQAKSDLTLDAFKNHIKRIAQWLSIDF